MNNTLPPIARAIHDLAHVYTQCDRLLERLEALMLRPFGTDLPSLSRLSRHSRFDLEALWIQDQAIASQGFSFHLIPGKQGAKKPKAQLCFIVVLAPMDADYLDALSPVEPYLLTFVERSDRFEAHENCLELTGADEFDSGLRGERPWLLHSGDLGERRWHEQPDCSWWAFATRLLELRDDQSLMQRVVAPCLQLLDGFKADLPAPQGAFHFARKGDDWHCLP